MDKSWDRRLRIARWTSAGALTIMVLIYLVELMASLQGDWRDVLWGLWFKLDLLIYIAGAHGVWRIVHTIRSKHRFTSALPHAMQLLGWTVLLGSVMTLIAPLVPWAISGGEGSIARFDPAAFVVGVIGLLLLLMSDLIKHGLRVEKELDEFV